MKRHTFLLCIILIFGGVAPRCLLAQRQAFVNPVQRADLLLASSNPAALAWGPRRLVLGTEILHAGFVPTRALGLNEQKLHLAFPYWLPLDLAFGIDLRSFNALIYSELDANFLVSCKIFSQFALGLKFGITNRGFDRSQFTLVEANDPLLANRSLRRSTPNVGAGLYWNAGALSLGASFHHLNQPNLAFAGKAVQPSFFALGLSYAIGIFSPSVMWNDDGTNKVLGYEIAANPSKRAAFRLSYETSGPLRLETQILFQSNAKLAYAFTLPSDAIGNATSGSHALVYEHVLGREPEIGAPLLVLSTNRMNIISARYYRDTDAGVALNEMSAAANVAEEYIDPTKQLGNLIVISPANMTAQAAPEQIEEMYHALSAHAGLLLHTYRLNNLAVRVAPGERESARVFEKILRAEVREAKPRVRLSYQKKQGSISFEGFRTGETITETSEVRLSHERVLINIVVPNKRRHVEKWQLNLLAPNGTVIRTYQGTRSLPSVLEWDWRKSTGELVAAGQYRCKLHVQSAAGKKYFASADLEVTHTQRVVTLRVANEPKLSKLKDEQSDASVK